jgi:hypothetical protein
MTKTIRLIAVALIGLVLTAAAAPADPLEAGFLNPPESAKPQTWWHWMDGYVTKPGGGRRMVQVHTEPGDISLEVGIYQSW